MSIQLPNSGPLPPIPPIANLHDWQRAACEFVKSHSGAGLFLDCGMGKTLVTLEALYESPTAIDYLEADSTTLRVWDQTLVIGPKAVMQSTWQSEIEKFGFPFKCGSLMNPPGKTPTGKPRKSWKPGEREALLAAIANPRGPFNEPYRIWFINRDNIDRLCKEWLPLAADGSGKRFWPFRTVVLDEAQSFKNPDATRTKWLMKLRKEKSKEFVGSIERVIELTGTPTPHSIMDIWSLAFLLDRGERLENSFRKFKAMYFNAISHGSYAAGNKFTEYQLKPDSLRQIYGKLSDVVISVNSSVLPSLPEVIFNDIVVTLSDTERNTYNNLRDNMAYEFADGSWTDPSRIVTASNAGVLAARLSQLASGSAYAADGSVINVHERKLEALDSIVENTTTPIVVAYNFRCDKDRICEHFQNRKSERTGKPFVVEVSDGTSAMIERWNAGLIDLLLLQPSSSGFGINLQHGGHTFVWYTLPWSAEQYEQANARLYRQGQTHPVIIHRIITEDTIDQHIDDVLKRKVSQQNGLLSAVQLSLQSHSPLPQY